MPATSKRQWQMMAAVAHGWKGGPKGLSSSEASKFIASQPKQPKSLPMRARHKRKGK